MLEDYHFLSLKSVSKKYTNAYLGTTLWSINVKNINLRVASC